MYYSASIGVLCSLLIIVSLRVVKSEVTLEKNAYKDVVVTVAGDVQPTDVGEFFNRLEALLRSASKALFKATNGLWYFGEFRIVVPPGFETPPSLLLRNATWELFSDADVVVNNGTGTDARQSGGCGRPGGYVVLPEDNVFSTDIEAAARSLIRRWVQVRYGVFEETATAQSPQWCYKDGHVWKPTGCYSTNATIRRLDSAGDGAQCTEEDVNIENIFQSGVGPASSLLFTSTSREVELLCDSSGNHLHMPLAPTKHNLICDGQSAWDVIRTSEDYKMTHVLGRLRTTPPTSFNYVMPKEHHYIYLIQKCDSRNGSYHKIMAAANEGFRRFIVFSAPEQRSWRLALLYGETTEVLREFEAGDVWDEYLKALDSHVVHRCNASSSENVFQEVMKVIPKALPTTIVALLDSSMLNTKAIQKLKTQEYLRLSLVLFDADDLPSTVLSNAPTNTKLFVVPSQLDQEAMAASIDLALHNIHHSTAALYGDITKVYQKTSAELGDGMNGTFSVEPSTNGTLTFIVACSNVFNIADSDVTFDGRKMRSYREKMSMFATQRKLQSMSHTTWSYVVSATKSRLKCSAMASVRYPANEIHIAVRGWFDRSMVRPLTDDTPQVLFAELLSGGHNITDIKVIALVYASGFAMQQQQQTVELRDDGLLEPDITSGDGIYSAYLVPEVPTATWYTVIIQVTGTLVPFTNFTHKGSDSEEQLDVPEKEFFREEIVGSFWSDSLPTSSKLAYPFRKIYDLKVTELSYPNVTFLWTVPRGFSTTDAPGSLTQLRYSASIQDLLKSDQFSKLPGWNLPLSSPPKESESATIQLPKVESDATDTVYYVAARTVSHSHRQSRISNVVQVTPNVLRPTPTAKTTAEVSNVSKSFTATVDVPNVSGSSTTAGNEVATSNLTAPPPSPPPTSLQTQEPPGQAPYLGLFAEPRFYWLVAGVAAVIVIIILINILCCFARTKRAKTAMQNQPLQTLCRDVATSTADIEACHDNAAFDTVSLDSLKPGIFNDISPNGSITPIRTPLQTFSHVRGDANTKPHEKIVTPTREVQPRTFTRTHPLYRRRLPGVGSSTQLLNSGSSPANSTCDSVGQPDDRSGIENVRNAQLHRERKDSGHYYDLGYL